MGVSRPQDRCSHPWASRRPESTLAGVPDPKEADMPPGVYPVPKFRTTASRSVRTRASLALRLRTRWRRNRLDEKLAHGADPASNAELRLRAAQLRSRAERARLANALVEALGEARGPNLGAFTANARRRDDSIREYA